MSHLAFDLLIARYGAGDFIAEGVEEPAAHAMHRDLDGGFAEAQLVTDLAIVLRIMIAGYKGDNVAIAVQLPGTLVAIT